MRKVVLIIIVALCAVGSVQAAEITWGTVTDVSSVTDVVNEGDLVEAFNGYITGNVVNIGTVSPTVNGVLFTGTMDLLASDSGDSTDTFGGDTGDAGYNDLLSSVDYGGGGGFFTLDLGAGSLISGNQYLIQVWFTDTRYTNRTMQFGDGNGNTVDLISTPGQYAIGTFIADGTTQALSFDALNMGNAHITAYQIREMSSVPLPTLSTTAVSPVSGSFTVDVEFTEAMTGLEESDFSVANGSVQASSLSGSDLNWSLVIVPTVNGDVSVMLPAGSVTDVDGDGNSNPESNTLELLYLAPGSDQPWPVLSTASSVVTDPYIVDIVFDEDVTGLELGDFDISNGTVSDLTSSSATIYSVLVTPSSGGDVTISLPAGMVTDLDGDNLQNIASDPPLVTTYVEPLSVSIYGPLTSTEVEFNVYLTFSEAVSGLEMSDLQVSNGSVLSITEQGRREFADRYYIVSLRANAPGTVTVIIPAGVVTDAYSQSMLNDASSPFITECSSDFMKQWVVDDADSWTAATDSVSNMDISGGFAEPTADTAQFTSVIKTFPVKRKATGITFGQSPVWDNWTGVSNVGASGAGDATILLPIADNDYYHLGRGSTGGYHAWHSTDMVNWTHYGPITAAEHRWVTTAEYKDGMFYIYVDNPNDHTPHLYVDDDLKDGVIGTFMGMAFNDPTHGSDCSIFRDNADGLFHIISEDWTPINAKSHSWDSPLATHASSEDGFNGFEFSEHVPPIDFRTEPTGQLGTYDHPHVDGTLISNPCYYEIHEPEQDAHGDWTSIKIGSQYYFFSDFDHADGSTISVARFTSGSIYEELDIIGTLGSGHPDPTVGFADGQFYLITQMSTDYTSPGPWVDGVEARVGVDTDGDGTIDQWTPWQGIQESYDHTLGYARVVTTTPAQLDLSELPEGYGFGFEFQVDDTVVANISPIMDRVEMKFDHPLCNYSLVGDEDIDCDVDLGDLELLIIDWLVSCNPYCDADFEDFAAMASNWLVNCNTEPENPACIPVQ